MVSKSELPCFNFNSDKETSKQADLTNKVRQACQTHGCFLVKFDNCDVPNQFLTALKKLFDLPEETKSRYNGRDDAPFSQYERPSVISEYFGIDDADCVHVARDFTSLMWEHNENPTFCEVLSNTSAKMLELTWIILKMVLKSFDITNCTELFEKENTTSHIRLMKYEAPPNDAEEKPIGLVPHTDKNFVTILCQNDVQGLEVLSKKDGAWSEVIIPNGCYIVFLGDALKAWSNGRIHSPKHRVIATVGATRYSCALFLAPKGNRSIEVSQIFVDEDHPIRYRPFTYFDFLSFYTSSNFIDEALELFASI